MSVFLAGCNGNGAGVSSLNQNLTNGCSPKIIDGENNYNPESCSLYQQAVSSCSFQISPCKTECLNEYNRRKANGVKGGVLESFLSSCQQDCSQKESICLSQIKYPADVCIQSTLTSNAECSQSNEAPRNEEISHIHQQASCSRSFDSKHFVDIVYVVDNSNSSFFISKDIKDAVLSSIAGISKDLDYRIVMTTLLKTANGNDEFHVLASNPTTLPEYASSKRVSSVSEFLVYFNKVQSSQERGLESVRSFIAEHSSMTPASDRLLRQGAHLFIILLSNGRDTDVELGVLGRSGETVQNTLVYNERKDSFLNLKASLSSQQFRLLSFVPFSGCMKSGFKTSEKSYIQMSKELYNQTPFPTDQSNNLTPDSYDLCSELSSLRGINAIIHQAIGLNIYKRWPITFTDSEIFLNSNQIQVYKSSPSSRPELLSDSSWSYVSNQNQAFFNTRILPTEGEQTSARHLIEFTTGNEVEFPECIQIASTEYPEYFGYIVVEKNPEISSMVVKINDKIIPQNSTNGWSYLGEQIRNIKVQHKNSSDQPASIRSGYLIKLNGSNNYYEAGDNVELHYQPAN